MALSIAFLLCSLSYSTSVSEYTYAANNPNEDRMVSGTLDSLTYAGVFDGHGGQAVSQLLAQALPSFVQQHLTALSKQDSVESTATQLFDELEAKVLASTEEICPNDECSIGACATVAFVTKDWLAVANTGDCQAVLVRRTASGFIGENLCPLHSANNPAEQEKLKLAHPDDPNIIRCRRACYVKGRLMPTRSFGDFHLKYAAYSQLSEFRGPYITHQPDVETRRITADDLFLVLGTDGLWDELSPQAVADLLMQDPADPTRDLVEAALQEASRQIEVSVDDLRQIPPGKRRRYHDDITAVVVPLQATATRYEL